MFLKQYKELKKMTNV